jgi:hypothetical protein
LSGGDPATAVAEQAHAIIQPGGDLGQAEHRRSGCGQFEGKRDTLDFPADGGHYLKVVVVEGHPGTDGAQPVNEQLPGVSFGHGRHRIAHLAGDREGLAAGRQHLQVWGGLEELSGQAGGMFDEVLAVVDDQQ